MFQRIIFPALLFISIVLLSFHGLYAQEEQKDILSLSQWIQVKTIDEQEFRGGFQSISEDSVIFMRFSRSELPQDTITISVNDISGISLPRKSKFFKRTGWGTLGGFSLGSLVGLSSGGIEELSAEAAAMAVGLFFGGIGALIGGSLGAMKGVDVDVPWEGKSTAEKKVILSQLSTGKYSYRHKFRASAWAGSISPPFEEAITTMVGAKLRFYLTPRSGLELAYARSGWFTGQPSSFSDREFQATFTKRARVDYVFGGLFISFTRNKLVNPFGAWGWGLVSTNNKERIELSTGEVEEFDTVTEKSVPLILFSGIEIPITNWLSVEGRVGHIWYFWQQEGHLGFQLALTFGAHY